MRSLVNCLVSVLIVFAYTALGGNNAMAKSPTSYYVVVAGKKIPDLSRNSDDWWHILTGDADYKQAKCSKGEIVIQRKFKTDGDRDTIIAKLNSGRWDVRCEGSPHGLLYTGKQLSCNGGVSGSLGKRIQCTFKP